MLPADLVTGVPVEAMAHGGDGVGRHQGKAVFIPGTIPGDVVDARVVERRARFERARVDRVVRPSPDRTTPPCTHFLEGCGGCQWQMGGYEAQLHWKRETVASQLLHLGRLEVPVDEVTAVGPPYGYRNRMDFRLRDGRPVLARARSHDEVDITRCHLLVEALQRLFHGLGSPAGRRVTLRAGVRTGETATIVDGGEATIHEIVDGVTLRISGRAFFQVNTAGADALVAEVSRILAPGPRDVLLDGYAGGGLFAATVGGAAGDVIAVESDRRAISDLRHNVPGARVVPLPMERAMPEVGAVDLAVVDPPREGLGAAVVRHLTEADPRTIALVSCDVASFARDSRLLVDAGYRLRSVRPFDLFPQTFHVEVVGAFER